MIKTNLKTDERFWNIAVEGNKVSIEYGLNDSDEAKETSVEIEEGKAGRTVEQEALKNAYNRVSKQVDKGYEGDTSEITEAYTKMLNDLEVAKEVAKAEKERIKEVAKAEAKVEKLREKISEKREALEALEAELAEAEALIADENSIEVEEEVEEEVAI